MHYAPLVGGLVSSDGGGGPGVGAGGGEDLALVEVVRLARVMVLLPAARVTRRMRCRVRRGVGRR